MSDETGNHLIGKDEYKVPTTGTEKLPGKEKQELHFYTKKEIEFLDVYAETLDKDAARKASGMTVRQIERNSYLAKEIRIIQKMVQKKHRLKTMKMNHLRMMEKFEEDYDKLKDEGDNRSAVGMAGTLARMSETGMKATGDFHQEKDNTSGMQVSININLEHNYDEPPTIDVTPDD